MLARLIKHRGSLHRDAFSEAFDALANGVFVDFYRRSACSLDVVEKDGKAILSLDVPGFRASDLEVTADGDTVSVTGARGNKRVSHSWSVSDGYDASSVTATLADGVLELEFAKRAPEKSKRVEIKQRG